MKSWINYALLAAIVAGPAGAEVKRIDSHEIDAHLRFVSSDLLDVRTPATRRGRLAGQTEIVGRPHDEGSRMPWAGFSQTDLVGARFSPTQPKIPPADRSARMDNE